MTPERTSSICGQDVTVRKEDSIWESVIKRRRADPPLEETYPLDIQFYKRVPCPILTETMKELVKERISVLKEIHLVMENSRHVAMDETRRILISKLRILRLHRYARLIDSPGHRTHTIQELEDRAIDHASFVALRLALISDIEERDSHQKIEEELFHLRVAALDDEGIRELLKFNGIKYEKINHDERIELKEELTEFLQNSADYDNTEFFKVPVLTLLGFINIYDIHIRNGIAYVPLEHMRAVLRVHYHRYLKNEAAAVDVKSLRRACKFVDGMKKFSEFFKYCCMEFGTMQYKIMKESNISVSMIDTLARTAFPPCMRVIHDYLREHHHLKHESRLQYTLFLKGIGLRVQDTLTLFRREFLQTVSLERFEKEYTYYVYHAYGLRGRKIGAPPKDCSSIIDNVTPFGDCNGCVFAHNGIADMEDLGRKLSRWHISEDHIAEIVEHTKKSECGHACATYFHAINKHVSKGPITHPNRFFNDSRYLSSLPEGCFSDSSDALSDDEQNDMFPDTMMDVDNDTMSTTICDEQLSSLIQMVIDWEHQICPDGLRAGTMVKLKQRP